MPMIPTVHMHASGEGGIFANAYLVETALGVVAIDALLTRSESRALRSELEALSKPLLAVLVTHAHPDHVAGLTELVADLDVPILALRSVVEEMRTTEAAKHAQWRPVFGEEWIDRWTYPDRVVANGETIALDGVVFRVHDVGAGGDSPANAIWTIAVAGAPPHAAFVGDLVFSGTHVYMADGYVLAWLANLGRFGRLLGDVPTLYPGHGPAGPPALLDQQRAYLLAYCAAVRELAEGEASLTEPAKRELEGRMEDWRPGAPLGFMVSLSADAVVAELASGGHALVR